jgi:hypothetical protein
VRIAKKIRRISKEIRRAVASLQREIETAVNAGPVESSYKGLSEKNTSCSRFSFPFSAGLDQTVFCGCEGLFWNFGSLDAGFGKR